MRPDGIEPLFHALSDANRRRMIDQLTMGPASVSELAKPLGISLPAVVQHLQVLEASGLVESQKVGRVRTCTVRTQALGEAERWISAAPAGLGAEPGQARRVPRAHSGELDTKEQAMSDAEQTAGGRSTVHSTFVIERRYAASPQRVFDAWAEPEAKAQWFGPPHKPEGSYELDFRVGGREHLAIAMPDGDGYTYDAIYQDIVPGQRILYTYEMHRGETPHLGLAGRGRRSRPTETARSCA